MRIFLPFHVPAWLMASVIDFNFNKFNMLDGNASHGPASPAPCGKATKKAAEAAFHVPVEPVYLGCNFNAAELMQ